MQEKKKKKKKQGATAIDMRPVGAAWQGSKEGGKVLGNEDEGLESSLEGLSVH